MYLYKGFIVHQKEHDRICLKSIIKSFTAYDEFLKTLHNFCTSFPLYGLFITQKSLLSFYHKRVLV